MNATLRAKRLLKEAFPSIWLHWHLMHQPATAEHELKLIDRCVPGGAVTVDVGAHCGLYTRTLARLSRRVHAFEPSHKMADILRRTSAPNVNIYELALSDQVGEAELFTPQHDDELVYGLASLEPRQVSPDERLVSTTVPMAPLDTIVHEDVAFVKIDVEGHELNVLNGAAKLLENSQPIFLVEAEDRHRKQATQLLFAFFEQRSYRGFFIKEDDVVPISQFDVVDMQDVSILLPDGGRQGGKAYINNFFFFPQHLDGESILNE